MGKIVRIKNRFGREVNVPIEVAKRMVASFEGEILGDVYEKPKQKEEKKLIQMNKKELLEKAVMLGIKEVSEETKNKDLIKLIENNK